MALEFERTGGGEGYFLDESHFLLYRVQFSIGESPEHTQALWVDPDQAIDMAVLKNAKGPLVLYKADKAYYENPKTPDCN